MKRIFTAIDITNEARVESARYIENLKKDFGNLRVGWEKSEKLHLTLKFLGDLDETELSNLSEAVCKTTIQISKFDVQISGTGVFPSKRNARVLWLGIIERQETLSEINKILENECASRGFAKEKRSFKPHLTIARLREPQISNKLIEKHLSNNFESEFFTVRGITIYESRLLKSGSIYSIVLKHDFK